MPVICPAGHQSAAGDYCDECGVRLPAGAGPTAGGSGPPAAPAVLGDPAATVIAAPAGTPAAGTAICRVCGAPRVGAERFCENDAYDFLTGMLPAPDPAAARPASTTASWALTVTADRAWWQEMATELPFPDPCPVRTFALTGQQVLLGRRPPGRGSAAPVDLSGPPMDEGISHAHALLTCTDSGWQLSDAGSTNGTWLPGADAPIAAGQHVLLADGDTFFIGAWTAVTVRAT